MVSLGSFVSAGVVLGVILVAAAAFLGIVYFQRWRRRVRIELAQYMQVVNSVTLEPSWTHPAAAPAIFPELPKSGAAPTASDVSSTATPSGGALGASAAAGADATRDAASLSFIRRRLVGPAKRLMLDPLRRRGGAVTSRDAAPPKPAKIPDVIVVPPGRQIVLVAVNPRSGGRAGARVLSVLRSLLPADQILELGAALSSGAEASAGGRSKVQQTLRRFCGATTNAGCPNAASHLPEALRDHHHSQTLQRTRSQGRDVHDDDDDDEGPEPSSRAESPTRTTLTSLDGGYDGSCDATVCEAAGSGRPGTRGSDAAAPTDALFPTLEHHLQAQRREMQSSQSHRQRPRRNSGSSRGSQASAATAAAAAPPPASASASSAAACSHRCCCGATSPGDVRILVCGGDGSVAWVMQECEAAGVRFPISVLPLGTGNDMSRCLGWGPGVAAGNINRRTLAHAIAATARADEAPLDRWRVTVTPTDGGADGGGVQNETPSTSQPPPPVVERLMCNYFSVGVDAEIALQFHQERESNPDAFTSRWMNLIHYARIGFTNALASQVPVARAATVRDAATGAAVPMEPDWEGCIVASVPCYQGGRDFWGKKRDALFRPSSFSDGLLEVMGVESLLHVGFVQIDLDRAIRVAQAKAIEIQLKEGVEMPVQVDGEPWRQRGPCRISITRAASYPMLLSPDATTVVAASGGATPVAPTAMTGSDASASSSSGGGRRGGGGVRRRSTVSPGAGALRQEATGTTTVHDECEREQEPHVASSSRAAAVAAATWNRLAAGAVASSSGAVRVAKGVLRRTRTV